MQILRVLQYSSCSRYGTVIIRNILPVCYYLDVHVNNSLSWYFSAARKSDILQQLEKHKTAQRCRHSCICLALKKTKYFCKQCHSKPSTYLKPFSVTMYWTSPSTSGADHLIFCTGKNNTCHICQYL